MNNLTYQNRNNQQQLFVEKTPIIDIAQQVGTPFYCYSKKALVDNFLQFDQAFKDNSIANYKICYAIKANCNIHLVKILADLGSGIDAVSAGEIHHALKADINPQKIVFAGVGKTKEEIEYALKNGVNEFAVESIPEMHLLNKVALDLGKKAKFLLRVNPDIDAKTHDKISTGRKSDKFGVDIDLATEIYKEASNLKGLEIYGISTHIGSQITDLEPFKKAFTKIRELCLSLKESGYKISNLDFGGGIAIKYKDENIFTINDYVKIIKELTCDLDVQITIAPGRAIMANAGVLVSKVTYIKETADKNFAIIDAAMNDLARPGLYDAYHQVLPLIHKEGDKKLYDFAGPVCETTDILAKKRTLSELKAGDIIALLDSGAYGSSMSNQYNCRPLIPEILVDGDKLSIIRKRPTFDEMLDLYYTI